MIMRRFIPSFIIICALMAAAGCAAVTPPAQSTEPTAEPTVAPAAAATEEPTEEPAEESASTLAEVIPIDEAEYENLEDFEGASFSDPTTIDNQWQPLIPGMRWVLEGATEEEDGESTPHQIIFTVTDLTKVIAGVRTVVVWDQDYADGVLEEAELAFFAQDDDGNVWHFGEYPEEYEDGEVSLAPAWIHGLEDAQAGISMKADPEMGAPSYSQGWGPAVGWSDRARTAAMGLDVCVPFDCYVSVLVMDETSLGEGAAFQQKYYAPGVGNIKVGWKGDDATREELEMVERFQMDAAGLAEAQASALELEQSSLEHSPDVFALTEPLDVP